MNAPNIHALLARITTEQIRQYLARDGWREFASDGRLNFEKEVEPGETQTVFVPSDRTHGKFKSFLQNALFSLSVVEKREPFDIASDIVAITIPKILKNEGLGPPLYEIASTLRGISQVCIDSEPARGKLLELAKLLLGTSSRSITMSTSMASELWEVCRSDVSYLASKTMEWLESNTH